MTQSGIEYATFRLVAQCLNQLRKPVPEIALGHHQLKDVMKLGRLPCKKKCFSVCVVWQWNYCLCLLGCVTCRRVASIVHFVMLQISIVNFSLQSPVVTLCTNSMNMETFYIMSAVCLIYFVWSENKTGIVVRFFRVIPRRLNFICRRFGTLYLFHLHRQVDVKND